MSKTEQISRLRRYLKIQVFVGVLARRRAQTVLDNFSKKIGGENES